MWNFFRSVKLLYRLIDFYIIWREFSFFNHDVILNVSFETTTLIYTHTKLTVANRRSRRLASLMKSALLSLLHYWSFFLVVRTYDILHQTLLLSLTFISKLYIDVLFFDIICIVVRLDPIKHSYEISHIITFILPKLYYQNLFKEIHFFNQIPTKTIERVHRRSSVPCMLRTIEVISVSSI